MSSTNYPMSPSLNSIGVMSRRLDRLLLPGSNEIVREHAKLVQDINSLKQVVFISPLVDEVRDYDDSIFHDQIETSTTPRSSLVKPKPIKNHSIPIILLGGESQNEPVQTQPVRYPKPIKLVGTSVSPLVKHPYPFVLSAKSQRPFKVCMQPLSLMYPTTRRPGLLQRIINSIIPRQIGCKMVVMLSSLFFRSSISVCTFLELVSSNVDDIIEV